MLAKNTTALGKFCLILAVSANCYAQSWNRPLFEEWQRNDNIVGVIYNSAKWFGSRLSADDNVYHSQAVFHALNNADNGQEVQWYSERSPSQGRVKIVYTWLASGSTCRRLQHYIRTESNQRSWAETACMNANDARWVFTDK